MNDKTDWLPLCEDYLRRLCIEISDRSVGSEGNREATRFFSRELKSLGWKTETPEFPALDWHDGGSYLRSRDRSFEVQTSPYSPGCDLEAPLLSASSVKELESLHIRGSLLLLHGEIAREQLMPKNFVFYNPEEHQHIISLLEKGEPKAILCATSRNAALAGGVYPFPMIEDGDFHIPSVYMTEEEGRALLSCIGQTLTLQSDSTRIASTACNVIGRMGAEAADNAETAENTETAETAEKILVTAHIDAKKGTPGAIDNATGVIILLLLARLLKDYRGKTAIELLAFNGEDYYAVPGQMDYIRTNQNSFDSIRLNINIDGAGFREGPSCFSLFGLPAPMQQTVLNLIDESPDIVEAEPWPQGDHSIFVQYGRPALAVSSKWFIDNIDDQDITHTPKDQPGIVDCSKVLNLARSIHRLILNLSS